MPPKPKKESAGRPNGAVRLTLEKAATEFDVHRSTLTKRLRASEAEHGDDGKYSILQIVRALYDDADSERTRLYREQADKLALQRQQKSGELFEAGAIYRAFEALFTAVRQKILACPGMTSEEKDDLLRDLQGAGAIRITADS